MRYRKLNDAEIEEHFTCTNCKKRVHIIAPLGKSNFCGPCMDMIQKNITSRISPYKLRSISYLEKEMLILLFFELQILEGAKIVFQHEIIERGCNIEGKSYQNDVCDKNHYNCHDCKYDNEFIKYILDFSIMKNKIKIDLELDGINFHNKTKDNQRDIYMKKKGWIVLRYSTDVVLNHKKEIIEEIKRCLDGKPIIG